MADLAQGAKFTNVFKSKLGLPRMGESDEVESFIKEIAEESNVAHHIKNLIARKIPLLENCSGFKIEA